MRRNIAKVFSIVAALEGTKSMSLTRKKSDFLIHSQFGLALGSILALGACGQQSTYNDQAKTQYAQEAQQKKAELAPAVGNWCGPMYMKGANLPTSVTIDVSPVPISVQAPSSQDPNLIAQQYTLGGTLNIPILDRASSAAYAELPDLVAATGGEATVKLSNGDYNPQNEPQITLPFAVSNSTQSVYGVVQGDLASGHFVGTWLSNSNQPVGTFDLHPCNTGDAS